MDNFLAYLHNSTNLELLEFFAPRVMIALICGAIVGLERELKGKAAGLRTSIIICLGSTLFASIAVLVHKTTGEGDPTRMAAQIISGIGFLGGGVILHSQNSVYGITTAATIWLVAAIGVTIGVELYPVALGISGVCVAVLVIVRWLEQKFTSRVNNQYKMSWIEIESDITSTNNSTQELNDIYSTLAQVNVVPMEVNILKSKDKNIYKIKATEAAQVCSLLNQKSWVTKISHQLLG